MSVASPRVAVFDVNETLSDLSGLRPRLTDVGAPPELLAMWFAATLREGFAITAAGGYADFSVIAVTTLAGLLADTGDLRGEPVEAAEHVVSGMTELELHADVGPGLRALAAAGVRIVTLSNGAAAVAESLLERAGLGDLVEAYLSVSDAGRWKPAPEAYAHAARRCAAGPNELALVAVHPWDIDGARRAGLRTGWLARTATAYPRFFLAPDATGRTLPELVSSLVAAGDSGATRAR